MEYGNYKIDLEDIHSSIVPKKLTAKSIPTRMYDGSDIVELLDDQLEGLVGGDNPILSITMSGKDVGAVYRSHVVKFVSGALASNYYVADDDPNSGGSPSCRHKLFMLYTLSDQCPQESPKRRLRHISEPKFLELYTSYY